MQRLHVQGLQDTQNLEVNFSACVLALFYYLLSTIYVLCCTGVPKTELGGPSAADEAEVAETGRKGKKSKSKKPEPLAITPQITTAQTSLGHTSAVDARDKAYQVRHNLITYICARKHCRISKLSDHSEREKNMSLIYSNTSRRFD